MSERKLAEQFNQAWERRAAGEPPEAGRPEDVQQALDTASQLSLLDYSDESSLRESLRRQLQAEYAAQAQARPGKVNWARALAALGSVAGLAILMLCFVLGFSWIIRTVLPGAGPAFTGPAFTGPAFTGPASEEPPGVASLPATASPVAGGAASPAPELTAVTNLVTEMPPAEYPPPYLGIESSPDTIAQSMQDPAWESVWLQGQILTQDQDGQPAVVQVEAWMDRQGRGRLLSSAQGDAQNLETSFDPARAPSQAWVSDGQVIRRLDRQTGQIDEASLEQGWPEQLFELAAPLLDLLFPGDLPDSTAAMEVLQNTTWAGRQAVLVEWEGSRYWIDAETGQILRLQRLGSGEDLLQEISIETILYDVPLTEEALSAQSLAAAGFQDVGRAVTEPEPPGERPVPTEAPIVPPSTPTPTPASFTSGEPVRITLSDGSGTSPADEPGGGDLFFTLRSLSAPVERRLARLPLACLLTRDTCQARLVPEAPPVGDAALHWSPDGERAALIDFYGKRLWRFDPRQAAWMELAGDLRTTTDIAFWSPEGDWIAVTAQPDGSQDSLITLVTAGNGAQGARLQTFAQDLGGMQTPLGWQDAYTLVFMHSVVPPKGSSSTQAGPGLFRLDARSGEVTEVDVESNPAWLSDYPALSPGGWRLALSLAQADAGLATLNLESGETDYLDLPGGRPVWSPDGDRIAFLAAREVYEANSGPAVVVIVADDNGANQRKVFEWDSIPQVGWTQDGEHLLVAVTPAGDETPGGGAAFYLVSLETGLAHRLVLEGEDQEYEFIAPAIRQPGQD